MERGSCPIAAICVASNVSLTFRSVVRQHCAKCYHRLGSHGIIGHMTIRPAVGGFL